MIPTITSDIDCIYRKTDGSCPNETVTIVYLPQPFNNRCANCLFNHTKKIDYV